MKLTDYAQLSESVKNADLVLIGLGEEWIVSSDDLLNDLNNINTNLYCLYETAYNNEQYKLTIPVLEHYYYTHFIPQNLKLAYINLHKLLENKNYFIVSLAVDNYLKSMDFLNNRCVNPCGNIELMQCDLTCNTELKESNLYLKKVEDYIDQIAANNDQMSQKSPEVHLNYVINEMDQLICSKCGSKIVFNTLDAKKYCEDGYLSLWQTYMKWLQGTVNKKLCVIEAGVGLQLPSVIRFPFEKTTFFNQKSEMFRIHNKYSQVPENVTNRAYACNQNSVLLFTNEKVEADL